MVADMQLPWQGVAVRHLDPHRVCSSVNEHLSNLTYAFDAGDRDVLRLTVEDAEPVVFPRSVGGEVQGGSSSWVAKKHRRGAIHEPGLIAALVALREIKVPIGTIFDIGALYGYVSLVSRALFPGAEVHAFEANPSSFHSLERNFASNRAAFGSTLHAHHQALSDTSEAAVPMSVHRMRVDAVRDDAAVPTASEVPRIDVWSLDDFCRERNLLPDLIKLDVEGYQAKIVPGARGIISAQRPLILLEFDAPGAVNDFGVTNREVISPLLEEDGYTLLWGDHRQTAEPFEIVRAADLTDAHEVNSLGILVP